jgi:hypothetical protein
VPERTQLDARPRRNQGMRRHPTLSFALASLLVAACGPEPVTGRPPPNPPGSPAVSSSASRDAATAAVTDSQSSFDAGVDAGSEARLDAGVDASLDVAASGEAGHDAVIDAPSASDASGDAHSDGPPPPVGRAPAPGDVVIDEVLANPTGSDLGREWIEVASRSADLLDLSSLHLADTTTDVAVPAGPLAPGAFLVLGQSADPTKNGGAPVSVAYGTRLILNNEGEQISICLGACATGVILDRVSWGTVGPDFDGHAIVVDPDAKAICPATEGFGTAGDFGTPGAPNASCASPDAGAEIDAAPRAPADASAEIDAAPRAPADASAD